MKRMSPVTSRVDKNRFAEALATEREWVEGRLVRLLDELSTGPEAIGQAIRYMVLDSGKRLRPILCLWTHDALSGTRRDACLDVACAVECLHTYSLIHDDLPCMDDDDLRRGKPSCHKQYGEAMAVLAGDALLTLCFDILASVGKRWDVPHGVVVPTIQIIARAAGTDGLIGGQVLDISSDAVDHTLEAVEAIHRRKTAALISASMETGAVLAGVTGGERQRIRRAGLLAGTAFQIVDDLLDIESDGETLGKTPGKDQRDGKLTYPSVVGIEESRAKARGLITEATSELRGRPEADLLVFLLDYMVERRR